MKAVLRVINNERLALIAGLLLLAGQGVYSWQLAGLYHETDPIEITRTVPALPTFSQLSAMHVFGLYVPKPPKLQDAGLSSLNFTVTGLFLAEPVTESTALIDVGNGKSKMYKLGDHLQNNVTLYKITKDAVIVERDGHYETIPLDKSTLKFNPPADPLIWDNRD